MREVLVNEGKERKEDSNGKGKQLTNESDKWQRGECEMRVIRRKDWQEC